MARTIVGAALAAGVLLAGAGCGGGEEEQAPRVREQLKSKSPAVRGEAARRASELGGGEAKQVTGDLIEALKAERDASVRSKLVVALGQVASQADSAEESLEVIPALIDTLGDEDPIVRNRTRQALAKIGPEAGGAVSKLVEGLKTEDVDGQWWTLTALGGLEEQSLVAVSDIATFLNSNEPRLRARAAWALGQIGPGAKEAIGRLIALTKDDNSDVRGEAADALGLMGPEANSAIGALGDMEHDPISSNRAAAARAIKRIRGQ